MILIEVKLVFLKGDRLGQRRQYLEATECFSRIAIADFRQS